MENITNLSRRDTRNMLKILKYLVSPEGNASFIPIWERDPSCFAVSATVGGPTDEGFSRTSFSVMPSDDKPGWYRVEIYNTARDCDGPTEDWRECIVKLARRPKRFYMDKGKRGWNTGGRFYVRRLVWNSVVNHRQRDHFAEASGY